MNEQIKKYIDEARAHNIADPEIRANLAKAGWSQTQIAEGFGDLPAAANPLSNNQPGKSGFTHNGKLWGGVLILLLIVAGGGYYLYASAKNSPEKVWSSFKIQAALQHDKSVHTDQTLGIKAKAKTGDDISAQLTTASDTDVSDANNIQSSTNFALNFKYQGTSMTVDGVEARIIGSMVYINISKIPYVGQYAKDYDGWVKIDYKSAANGTKNPFDISQLKTILDQNNLVKSHTYESKEVLKGVDTYKYKIDVDGQAIKSIMSSTIDKLYQNNASTQLTPDQLQQAKSSISDVIDHTSFKNSEIWIGVADKTIRKIVLNAEYLDLSKIPDLNGPIQFSYSAEYSAYGEKVNVQAPAKSWDLQQAITSGLSGLGGALNPPGMPIVTPPPGAMSK